MDLSGNVPNRLMAQKRQLTAVINLLNCTTTSAFNSAPHSLYKFASCELFSKMIFSPQENYLTI